MGESDKLLSRNQVQGEFHGLSKQLLKHFQLSWTDMQLISQTTDLLKTGQDWETADLLKTGQDWETADLLKTGQDWETTDLLKIGQD